LLCSIVVLNNQVTDSAILQCNLPEYSLIKLVNTVKKISSKQ